MARIVVTLLGLTILLSRFGVNVSAFVTALGLGGLALSLAARDTLGDAIAGFTILVDQPFRVGDPLTPPGGAAAPWGCPASSCRTSS